MSGESQGRQVLWAVALAGLVGVVFVIANLDLPLVRNSLVYARAAENVIAHGFDPRPVVADSRLSYDKPIGFAWLAAPFVAWLGPNVGLKLVSALGTMVYLGATWLWLVRAAPGEPTRGERGWVLALATLGPIVGYQFWSAHPDGLFAGLFLIALTLAIELRARPRLAKSLLFAGVVCLAVLLKNYGLILLPCAALYCALDARRLSTAGGEERRGLMALLAVSLVLVGFFALGWLGHNPLLRFEGEGGGVGQYGQGSWFVAARGTLVQLALVLVLHLNFALLACFSSQAWSRAIAAQIACFALPYVAGLMLFPTTFYNMRYFVPLLPLAALVAVRGTRAFRPTIARALRLGAVGVTFAASLVFNVEPIYARVEARLPKLEVDWIGVPLSLLDNLRMPQHRATAAWLDHVAREVELGGTLYFLDANYYRDAQHGVYERSGHLRPDLRTRYSSSRDFAPEEPRFWVQGRLRDPALLGRFGEVTDLGLELCRVDQR